MPSLGRLRRIVQDVSGASTLDESLRLISDQVKDVMSVDVCSIYLMDADRGDLVLMCTQGLDPGSVGNVRMPIGDGLVGTIAERQQVLKTDDALQHPSFHYFPETNEELFHAFLGVPIVHYRQVVGVLVVQQQESRQFDSEHEAFLVTVAAQLAGTLSHAINSGKVSNLLKGRKKANTHIDGIVGSSGIGIGKVVRAGGSISFKDVDEVCALDKDAELLSFKRALVAVGKELDQGHQQMADTPGDVQAIFDAYRLILESDDLQVAIRNRIYDGLIAPAALKSVIEEHAAIFEEMDDPYFQARGEDIRNIGLRILRYLVEPNAKPNEYGQPVILIGDVVSVSDIAEVPAEKLAGIVCQQGSALSHTAILAGALGVPAVMGVGKLPLRMLAGQSGIVDGYRGRVYFQPSSALMAEYIRLVRQESEFDRALDKLRHLPGETRDGYRLSLMVNTGLLADISPGLEKGAEGIGLYRTEIPFMIHDSFPSEEEQYRLYRKVLKDFYPRPVTMRTLDIGGDKPLPYFPVNEDNPYLGWRGIRFTLDHPEIFSGQLRAMLRASKGLENLKILLPMVSSVDEVDAFLLLLDKSVASLKEEGVEVNRPPIGVMIEVPSTMFLLDFLAERVDFLSIGTNDLTQYLLAVDRNNDQVARLFSRLHPSVVRALHLIVEKSRKLDLNVSLCGELAADPAAVLLLLGLGVDSLSMNAHGLPRIKHVIRSFKKSDTEQLLAEALKLGSEKEIRSLLNNALEDAGLGGLIRSGV
ncbi:phosphoenolpyruvate--protein phosphotransferase [Motiliproteus sp. MSK22-1]|uniref:phosphoenolpyruvate--protein phosphotransferase n=1 Tax=Motiliproteus sp. MSK22-1 TaxID=1897630 RepID=UPI0009770DB6|nr:phosphoenolpyruvate--protein phosphotransferase [Motiliproteus sp. MSK22-1]OMH33711.1 phosphoenolpyruvate--protein phosphotransferase [Motiliproteus sp. MSK22-1]